MDSNFRKAAFKHILKTSGRLTEVVNKVIKNDIKSNFQEEFKKMVPGPAREQFLFNEVIKRGPPKLVPMTIKLDDERLVTYNVMPDYIMVDGVRVTMAPATAQKVANHFGLKLPTAEISKQIYQAADIKGRATPLSSSGYTDENGIYHSPEAVTANKINSSDAALYYNKLTNEEIEKLKQSGNWNNNSVISGFGKEILAPPSKTDAVYFGGWQGKDGNPLQPYNLAHKGGAKTHSEYALWTRLMGDKVTVTNPDGTTETKSVKDLFPATEKYKI